MPWVAMKANIGQCLNLVSLGVIQNYRHYDEHTMHHQLYFLEADPQICRVNPPLFSNTSARDYKEILSMDQLVLNSRFCAKKIENSEVVTINKFESVFLCSG